MIFSIYDAPIEGNHLWEETRNVTVTNGVYSVILGEETPLNLPFDIPYYLGLTVGNDEEMTPRQPLSSTPYALNAAALDGMDAGILLPETADMFDYLPPVGLSKTFRMHKYGEEISSFIFDEVWTSRTVKESLYPNDFRDTSHYLHSSTGLKLQRWTRHDSSNSLVYEHIYDPPVCSWTFGLRRKGESWGEPTINTGHEHNTGTMSYVSETWIWTFMGIEDLSLEAGSFQGCLKLHRVKRGEQHRIYWFAKGLGMVKRVTASTGSYSGSKMELVSYSLPGE